MWYPFVSVLNMDLDLTPGLCVERCRGTLGRSHKCLNVSVQAKFWKIKDALVYWKNLFVLTR